MVAGRWVLHLDMDAFFASVEQLTRPTLAERPVLVGGTGPRGVVAGASYQARVFGARSAMPMGQARRACPHAVVVPPRGALYAAVSGQVMAVLAEAAPVVEPVSLDEAFLEPPELAGADPARVTAFGAALRAAVRARTGLPASVGAGSGKQLAKIASELAKPDGLRVVAPAEEEAVLAPLPVRALWGVGPVAEAALHRLDVRTVGALAALPLREVTDALGGAVGTELHRLARGVDDRPVAPRGAAKQVSAETTFDEDLTGMAAVHDAVARLTRSAHGRLLTSGRAARTVTVKVRSADFSTHTRSETAVRGTTDLPALTAVAQRLARAAVPEGGVRLLGVSLAGLGDAPPPDLFDDAADVPDGRPDPGTDPPPSTPPEGPDAGGGSGDEPRGGQAGEPPDTPGSRSWRAGDDVRHPEHGHGWVQGAGHGRVTVRFETRSTGPGRARTLPADDPDLRAADPLGSLARRSARRAGDRATRRAHRGPHPG
ncbi:MAG TPA: DNA polymerase IV [Pseudonocardia sp.]